ncbi:MAG TPA: ABC transporter permease [Methylomirabilota bacterium]|nr:ABC transporter permease [Methylomirabilota bacterium]
MTPGLLVDPHLWQQTLVYAAPLIIAALGELIIERSGVLNVGIEGMMLVAAVTCFVVTWQTQMVAAGIGAGMLAAAAMALALVYYAVALRGPQITVGLGLYVLGIGLSSLIFRMVFGIRTSPPQIATLSPVAVPGLGDLPVVGTVFFQQTILTYAAFALIPLVHLALFRTAWGLRLRATGENPRAVDALGIDVAGLRYGAAAVGGLLIGLGGAYLPVVLTGTFSDNMTAGRGWLALMLVIFGRWMPVTVLAGALLFAYVEAFQFKAGMVSKAVPPQFLLMLPYVFALVVLVRVYRGASAPRALAVPYDREARG